MSGNAARRARDEALARVAEKNWSWLDRGLALLPYVRSDYEEATGEMLRLALLKRGLARPSSPNAWGMLIRAAVKRGILRDTGRTSNMFTEKSHARRTPVWKLR